MLTGGTLFSGIGAPECVAPWIDWRWCAEIDTFASAVLAHRFPDVPNLGDVTRIDLDATKPVDLIVFGSPCQSFSVAGKRAGLDDPRGNMALVGLQVVDRMRPDWVVFENVPGILSSDEWRDFGTFLGALGECGYGFAYRVLDAQYAGVPQRRRRVFVVGYLGDWRPAAAVLFEPESLSGHSAPSREAGEGIARPVAGCSDGAGYRIDVDTVDNLIETSVTHSLTADHAGRAQEDGTGRGCPIIAAIAFAENSRAELRLQCGDGQTTGSLKAGGGKAGQSYPAIAFEPRARGDDGRGYDREPHFSIEQAPTVNGVKQPAVAFTLHGADKTISTATETTIAGSLRTKPPGSVENSSTTAVMQSMAVRRLTPMECERLQGFPDSWTAIRHNGKPATDGPRYRALGNAMAVPVIGWILSRIKLFSAETRGAPPAGRGDG